MLADAACSGKCISTGLPDKPIPERKDWKKALNQFAKLRRHEVWLYLNHYEVVFVRMDRIG